MGTTGTDCGDDVGVDIEQRMQPAVLHTETRARRVPQADRAYHHAALEQLQRLAEAVSTARAAVTAQRIARQQANQAAMEGAKRLQLIRRELEERAADNADRRQQLATEEQQLLRFQEHLQACRARAASLQRTLAELDEQSAATQTLPLVQDISAHAVLTKVGVRDVLCGVQCDAHVLLVCMVCARHRWMRWTL